MENSKRFIVYADLNCPFCFTLHERLLAADSLHKVDWRSIEHAPNIRFEPNDLHVHAELTEEVTRVREIADDVHINIPPGRPNSEMPTRMVSEAFNIDPDKAIRFRAEIYRSLWVDGKDFSDPDLLDELRKKCGLPELQISDETKVKNQQWQSEWEEGEFSRNIPSLVTADGNKILGLPATEIIEAFLSGDKELEFDEGAFCYLKPREKVLIASDEDGDLDNLAQNLAQEYQIEFARFGSAVYAACISDNPPDVVLIDTVLDEPDGFETCSLIKDHENSHNIPVIMFAREHKIETEIKAFDAGAVEYLTMPCAQEVLKARMRVLLRLKRTTDLLEQFSKIDSLTEIANRREFGRLFEKEWQRAKRTNTPLSLILLDVDYFKKYNDNYGHSEGDECLKKVAQTIEHSIRRPQDIVARFGGEEFVVLLPDTDKDGAMEVAHKIKKAIEDKNIPHKHSDIADHLTVGQGISSVIPKPLVQPRNLIDAADVALYAAKGAGRNTLMFNDLISEPDDS